MTPSRIQVLPPSAAERIAAGEVVERPASVVKELVENSLDARAGRITIDIEAAGRRLIRVADDGDGIPADQLEIAFERFATSKIRSADDLASVATYGFRGEALPSIAAVAHVTVVTRSHEAATAASLSVAGGVRQPATAAGGAEGTVITVEDLFYNTPARERFLKSPARETAVIVETVQALALAAPDVAFRLLDSGREVFWMPPESFETRARRALGPRHGTDALPIDAQGPTAITGVLGTPQAAQARRTRQWFLVNGRPVRSPMLARALDQAYHTLIPDDRVPAAVLYVRVPPETVDVNIHPRKSEIRFARDQIVFNDVVREVRRVLHGASLVHIAPVSAARPAVASFDAGPLPDAAIEEGLLLDGSPAGRRVPPDDRAGSPPFGTPANPGAGVAEPAARYDTAAGPATPGTETAATSWSPTARSARWPVIRPLGQLALTYVVGESGRDLVLVDQHAAHERVLYERLLDRRRTGGVVSQGLVTPATVEISPSEQVLLSDLGPALAALGFEVEPFGRGTMRLLAVPAMAAGRDPGALFRACLADLGADRGAHAGTDLEERLAIATACHTAVRAGDRLDPAMMTALLEDLGQARDPYSCFHGRPTIVRVRRQNLERWFYRAR